MKPRRRDHPRHDEPEPAAPGRQLDRAYRAARVLAGAADPLVVDLGYGATPVTAIELRARLAAAVRADVRVVGLEIDPVRVAAAQPSADPPGLTFARGGFELAGLRPVVVRVVQRAAAVRRVRGRRRLGRDDVGAGAGRRRGRGHLRRARAGWRRGSLLDATGPVSLTLAARLSTLDRPATLAERLPKALIHHNVPGEPIHALLSALDAAWRRGAGSASFGARQRWIRGLRRRCAAPAGRCSTAGPRGAWAR